MRNLRDCTFPKRLLRCPICKEYFIDNTGLYGNICCPNGCTCCLEIKDMNIIEKE